MRLNQFEYLLALRRNRSFTRAAEELYVTQPSISIAIQELEQELGCRLVVRTKKGVTFTQEGMAVLERAERIMHEVNCLRNLRAGGQEALSGTVTIASTPHFCNVLLTGLLDTVEQLHPALKLDIQARPSMRAIELVRTGELDLGVIQLCDVEQARLNDYIARGELIHTPLFTEPLVMAAAENHPLAGRPIEDPRELEPYPYATFGHSINQNIARLYREYGWERNIYCIGEVLALRRFLFQKQAISMIPLSGLAYGNTLCFDNLAALDVPCLDWDWNCHVSLIERAGQSSARTAEVARLLKLRCRELMGGQSEQAKQAPEADQEKGLLF